MPELKETRYFAYDEALADSEDNLAYRAQYPIRTEEQYLSLFDNADMQKAIGEASPIYLDNPNVANRIASFNPEAKIIVTLRDPIARALSGYQMWVRSGKEKRPQDVALQPGERWVEGSIYAPKLENYYRHFPSTNIKVILFEDLIMDTKQTMCDLFDFLDVARNFNVDTRNSFNSGGMPRSQIAQKVLYSLKKFVRRNPNISKLAPEWVRDTYHSVRKTNLQPAKLSCDSEQSLARYFVNDAEQVAKITGIDTSVWRLKERSSY